MTGLTQNLSFIDYEELGRLEEIISHTTDSEINASLAVAVERKEHEELRDVFPANQNRREEAYVLTIQVRVPMWSSDTKLITPLVEEAIFGYEERQRLAAEAEREALLAQRKQLEEQLAVVEAKLA